LLRHARARCVGRITRIINAFVAFIEAGPGEALAAIGDVLTLCLNFAGPDADAVTTRPLPALPKRPFPPFVQPGQPTHPRTHAPTPTRDAPTPRQALGEALEVVFRLSGDQSHDAALAELAGPLLQLLRAPRLGAPRQTDETDPLISRLRHSFIHYTLEEGEGEDQ
jgi:hypothetical protein